MLRAHKEASQEKPGRQHIRKDSGTNSGQVLVVEDEPEILEPLAHSLAREGYQVLRAEDGLTACRLIGTEEPDIILLDIMLPDLNGWEVCRMLREHPVRKIASTPVIMLTALSSPNDKIRGLELGADIYLPKPYSIRELLLLVNNLTRRRESTLQLEKELQNARQNDEERSNFTRLLFHELRNQLTVLDGYAQLLNSGKQTGDCVDAIERSSEYLNNLAKDVLLIRQVEDGHYILQREALILTDMLQELKQLYEVHAREHAATLKFLLETGPQAVSMNRPALKIIISTLIDNALKYGPKGQTVTITCRQTAERVDILVEDEGAGLAADEATQIFEPFYRGKNVSRNIQGSGLGLHGVRVLSRAMGGDVTLERHSGQGARFRVSLPLNDIAK